MRLTFVVGIDVDEGLVELSARRRNQPMLRAIADVAQDLEMRLNDAVRRDAVVAVHVSEVGGAYRPNSEGGR